METFDTVSLPQTIDQNAGKLAEFVDRHRRLLVLTGAGISTASGIPDYRDKDGTRRGRAPVQGPEFRAREAVRKRYWARSMLGWPTLARSQPNAGHRALAELEAAGRVGSILTQNVDGLHQQAGSNAVIELHGSIHAVLCLECGCRISRRQVQAQLEQANPALAGVESFASIAGSIPAVRPGPAGVVQALPDGDAQFEPDAMATFHVPACLECGGVLQPDVVFFGDGVPRARQAQAEQALAEADAVLVVGSSLMVLSGYRFCRDAAASGKPVAAINHGLTRADGLLSLKITDAAQDVLPALVRQLR
ncbi:MAG: Sir2 family NAD-dependent protein deacetylase [Janthinobacterium lividum]